MVNGIVSADNFHRIRLPLFLKNEVQFDIHAAILINTLLLG